MHPILLHAGPVTIYSYGVLVALGILLGCGWLVQRLKAAGEPPDLYLKGVFWMLLAGFAGARLLYVLYFPSYYLAHPLHILLDRGGLVWYGGLISSLIVGLVFARYHRLSIPRLGDWMLPPVALGLALGRVGCFFSGCCYGKPTTGWWAVHFPPGHETAPLGVHSTQLYESAGLLVLLGLLGWVEHHRPRPGTVMALFFIGYGVLRFGIEYARGDGLYWVGHMLTASQVFSLAGILGGGILLRVLFRRHTDTTLQTL